MATKAEEYRQKAEEAEAAAKATNDHVAREAHRSEAKLYRELAHRYERMPNWNK